MTAEAAGPRHVGLSTYFRHSFVARLLEGRTAPAHDRKWHKLPGDASRNGRSTPKADQAAMAILTRC